MPVEGPGDDHILGQGGRDYVDAGSGNDTVDLGDGDGGWARGGTGNDTITTAATKGTTIYGDDGKDELDALTEIGSVAEGGAGVDTLPPGSLVGRHPRWRWLTPTPVRGSEGDDTLAGGDGEFEQVLGEQGADVCSGGSGHDECHGGPLGTPVPSWTTPDLCKSDVEVKRNCRGEEADWSWHRRWHADPLGWRGSRRGGRPRST